MAHGARLRGKEFEYSKSGLVKAGGKPKKMDKKKKMDSGTVGKSSMMKRYS